MKILVTGARGQLGLDVIKELNKREIECLGVGFSDFDITDEKKVTDFIVSYCPDAVIHCAAYTAVDHAEDNQVKCRDVNANGTVNIANACKSIDAKMLYLSTDYVFSGHGDNFHDVADTTGPLSVYGQTKLDGELSIKKILDKYFIVRTSWVFGSNGGNFIKTMLNLSCQHAEVSVVSDQIGSPTYTADLAPLLCDMIVTDKYGTYHATNEGVCSWAELAEEVFRVAGCSTKVKHVTAAEYPTRAKRPINSRLSKESLDKAGFKRLPDWRDAVNRYIWCLHNNNT